jgi:hypothetical protein
MRVISHTIFLGVLHALFMTFIHFVYAILLNVKGIENKEVKLPGLI